MAETTISGNSSLVERTYLWILKKCSSRVAPYLLALLSFTESCIFIIPPELMLLPMSYANRKKSFAYALNTTISSVFGAMFGYVLGYFFWEQFGQVAFEYIPGFAKHFDHVTNLYKENAILYLFVAAFTPIPFKVFTLAAGVSHISFTLLVVTSLVGRGLRYFILSSLVFFLGEKAKVIIEKHFTAFTIFVGLLVVVAVLVKKFLLH